MAMDVPKFTRHLLPVAAAAVKLVTLMPESRLAAPPCSGRGGVGEAENDGPIRRLYSGILQERTFQWPNGILIFW
jgi:hypothetical protein